MEVKFVGNNLVEFNDCRICFRNFSGAESKYNRNGDRNFAIVIDSEEAKNLLVERGFNVKIKPPREEGDAPFMYLQVKFKYDNNGHGPSLYLESFGNRVLLDANSVRTLDQVDIENCYFDIRAFDWEMDGDTGTSAWLNGGLVIQHTDRFATMGMDRFGEAK